MNRVVSPLWALQEYYPIVVIGSGYGGAVAASRLARAGQQVCLLERGRELLPGQYPDTLWELKSEVQVDGLSSHIGRRSALFDFRSNKDMDVLVACGLGGGR
jgi:cholesterol oxidase